MNLRTPFANSFFFAVLTIARKCGLIFVPKDVAYLGDVVLSFCATLRRDEAICMTYSAPANGLNSIIGVDYTLTWECPSLSGPSILTKNAAALLPSFLKSFPGK